MPASRLWSACSAASSARVEAEPGHAGVDVQQRRQTAPDAARGGRPGVELGERIQHRRDVVRDVVRLACRGADRPARPASPRARGRGWPAPPRSRATKKCRQPAACSAGATWLRAEAVGVGLDHAGDRAGGMAPAEHAPVGDDGAEVDVRARHGSKALAVARSRVWCMRVIRTRTLYHGSMRMTCGRPVVAWPSWLNGHSGKQGLPRPLSACAAKRTKAGREDRSAHAPWCRTRDQEHVLAHERASHRSDVCRGGAASPGRPAEPRQNTPTGKSLRSTPDMPTACTCSAWRRTNPAAHAAAIELIGQAIALRNDDPYYHCNMANALQAHGMLAEAVAHFRRALLLKPDHAQAYSDLGTSSSPGPAGCSAASAGIRHRKGSEQRSLLPPFVHSAARSCRRPLRGRDGNAGAGHGVAAGAGSEGTAFRAGQGVCRSAAARSFVPALSSQATRSRAANSIYDEPGTLGFLDRIREVFSPRLLRDQRGHRRSVRRLPIFIVGMPRSGTTLVEQILGSHPQGVRGGRAGRISERRGQSARCSAAVAAVSRSDAGGAGGGVACSSAATIWPRSGQSRRRPSTSPTRCRRIPASSA